MGDKILLDPSGRAEVGAAFSVEAVDHQLQAHRDLVMTVSPSPTRNIVNVSHPI